MDGLIRRVTGSNVKAAMVYTRPLTDLRPLISSVPYEISSCTWHAKLNIERLLSYVIEKASVTHTRTEGYRTSRKAPIDKKARTWLGKGSEYWPFPHFMMQSSSVQIVAMRSHACCPIRTALLESNFTTLLGLNNEVTHRGSPTYWYNSRTAGSAQRKTPASRAMTKG